MNRSSANVCSILIVLCASLSVGATSAEELPNYSEHQDFSYYLDAAGAKRPVKTKADWQIRRQHILAHLQTVMGPLPKPKTPLLLNSKTIEETKVGSLVRRKISYHTDSPDRTVSA